MTKGRRNRGLVAAVLTATLLLPMSAQADDYWCDNTTYPGPSDDAANYEKYQAYMLRFLRKFIAVSPGDEPGTNMPFGRPGWNDFDSGLIGEGENPHGPMGLWAAVLASEFRLMNGRVGYDPTPTLRMLHYALKAFDRLDVNAESYWRIPPPPPWGLPLPINEPGGMSVCEDYISKGIDHLRSPEARAPYISESEDLNGYPVRGDMECDFNQKWFGPDSPNRYRYLRGFSPDSQDYYYDSFDAGVYGGTEQYYGHSPGYAEPHGTIYARCADQGPSGCQYPMDTSPEEYWDSIPGLALVYGLAPDYWSIDGEDVPLAQHARQIALRMLNFIRDQGWRVVNPVTGVPFGDGPRLLCSFNKGLNAAGLFFDSNFRTSYSLCGEIWGTSSGWPTYSLSAVGNINIAPNGYSTIWNLEDAVMSYDYWEHVPLIWKVLWEGEGTGDRIDPNWYGQLLNSAPIPPDYSPDNPQYNSNRWPGIFGDYNGYQCGWTASRWNGYGDHGANEANNGLDYMLLHNLYHLVYSSRATKTQIFGEKCGDSYCDTGETVSSCPCDCAASSSCGNGVCDVCEDYGTCPSDCAAPSYCGNGVCDADEDYGTCPSDCRDGDPRCFGACDATGRCAYLDVGTSCGLCSVCDGAGRCATVPIDDNACATIACHGLDTACRTYEDLTTNRCASLGTCKNPNDPASCTLYTDLACPDSGPPSEQDGGPIQQDGGPTNNASGGCGCRATPSAGPTSSGWLLAMLAAGLVVWRRRSS